MDGVAGASDHIVDRARQQSLEARIDDIRAVMDAAGSERAVLMGSEDGFSLAAMFAATHPERTLALVGWAASARSLWAPDYPGRCPSPPTTRRPGWSRRDGERRSSPGP